MTGAEQHITADHLPRWGVVCTASEPAALMVSFAAHHLSLGATHVWMFLDRPDPVGEALLARLPGCIVQVCDDDYWTQVIRTRRPRVITRRQLANADLVYSGTDLDWIVHIDCDEFLRADYPVAQLLAQVPDDTAYVMFRPAERAGLTGTEPQTIFDGVFRRPGPRPRRWERPLVEGDARMAWRGLTGHSIGKSATRLGQPVLLGIHSPRPIQRRDAWRPREGYVPQIEVLHFDGLTPFHWQTKLLRAAGDGNNLAFLELHDPGRYLQAREVLDQPDHDAAARALHDRLKLLDDAAVATLCAQGRLDTRGFDPTPALVRFGLSDEVDLSVAAFDAHLAGNAPLRSARAG